MFFVLIVLAAALAGCGLFGGKKLGKTELTEEMVRHPSFVNSYVYTGEPIDAMLSDIQVYFDGEFMDMDLFDVEISDNVNPGTASIKVTAKKENEKLKGSVTLHFNIVADGSKQCNADDDLNALLADPGYSAVGVWCDYTIAAGETLTVPEGQTLALRHGYVFNNYGTIINNGTIVMEGAYMYRAPRRNTEFNNYGSLENHGEINIKDYVIFNDLGTFTSDNEITNYGTFYLLDEDKSFLVEGTGGYRYIRKPLSADKVIVENCVFVKNKTEYTPSVSLDGGAGTYFRTEFFDNTAAGTAGVTVTVGERESNYYGSATVHFTIEKGVASVASFAELKMLAASGNFKEYQLSTLDISSDDSFSLPVGEKLTLSSRLNVYGRFVNAGQVSCDYFYVSSNGAFENAGALAVRGNTYALEGAFTNAATGEIDCNCTLQVRTGSTFVNRAAIANALTISVSGNFVNEGNVTIKNASISASVQNSGTLVYPQGIYLGRNGSFVNEEGATVQIEGDSNVNHTIENHGAIINKGRLALSDGSTIQNSGAATFDNSEGGVWTFAAVPGISANVVIKKYLTDESVHFEAEYTSVHYDKTSHIPAFTVDGETLLSDWYSAYLRYVGATKDVTRCVDTGEVDMRISIKTPYCPYAETYTYRYTILPSTIRIANELDFRSTISDAGYNEIILDTDISSASGSVKSGCTLDLNGHKLTVSYGTFYLHGSLVGGAAAPVTPSEERASILISESGYFHNYGSLTNDGLLYVKGGGYFNGNATSSSSSEQGVVINNGVIYTNYNYIVTATGSGVIYHRKNLKDMPNAVVIPPVDYDGTEKTPAPVVTYRGATVDNNRFTFRYSYNVNAGAGAMLTLGVADEFDQNFYGQVFKTFTINRGAITVTTASDLIAAAENANYDRIVFGADIALSQATTLSDGQTLNLDSYDLSVSGTGKVTFGNNCRLILTAGTEERFLKYAYDADEITLTANIGATGTRTAMTVVKNSLASIKNTNYLSTTVHMNGYSFVGGLKLGNNSVENFSITFENSSENVSSIGSSVNDTYDVDISTVDNDYAFVYGTCYEETYVTLRNMTVYGVKHNGGYGTAQVVDLSAENCKFNSSHSKNTVYAYKIWTGMTASGTYTGCTFEGANGFYVNRGYEYDHDTGTTLPAYFFYGCTFRAYGECAKYSTITDYYGNALTMDRNSSNLSVQIRESYFYSQNGNGIRVTNRTGVYLDIDSQTTFEHPQGKVDILG